MNDKYDEISKKYTSLSEEIANILHKHGITNYMIGYHTPEGPTIVGLFGNPIFLTMIHLQLGTDILEGMKDLFGIPKDGEKDMNINLQNIIDKKKMN